MAQGSIATVYPPDVTAEDEELLVSAIAGRPSNLRTAIETLDGVHGRSHQQWKDHYLTHNARLDAMAAAKMAASALSTSDPPSRASSCGEELSGRESDTSFGDSAPVASGHNHASAPSKSWQWTEGEINELAKHVASIPRDSKTMGRMDWPRCQAKIPHRSVRAIGAYYNRHTSEIEEVMKEMGSGHQDQVAGPSRGGGGSAGPAASDGEVAESDR
ncbi:hypothetical protein PLICRDRAFT_174446 [Plicaturopsis crispa FD-325 SS-3]|nr:hypothetical protein PLICRDRAFT_174446 [Plicaturopsis crispa FD-325 SS-3]